MSLEEKLPQNEHHCSVWGQPSLHSKARLWQQLSQHPRVVEESPTWSRQLSEKEREHWKVETSCCLANVQVKTGRWILDKPSLPRKDWFFWPGLQIRSTVATASGVEIWAVLDTEIDDFANLCSFPISAITFLITLFCAFSHPRTNQVWPFIASEISQWGSPVHSVDAGWPHFLCPFSSQAMEQFHLDPKEWRQRREVHSHIGCIKYTICGL